MRTYARAAAAPRVTWFEFGLGLFAAALPIGAIVVAIAPVAFLHAVGALITGMSLIGIWMSAVGLKLEHPERWNALKRSLRNRWSGSPAQQ